MSTETTNEPAYVDADDILTPDGVRIGATQETLIASAIISGVTIERGRIVPEYIGDTKVHWDAQQTETDGDGHIIFEDEHGRGWTLHSTEAGGVEARTPAPPKLRLDIPESAWQETGPGGAARARLLATITINGTDMHLEAWAVGNGPDQVAVAKYLRDDLERLQGMMDCRFQTTTIRGREYVLVATPHGD